MSNELITALEHRVTSAVDTIEGLRTEVRVLKEERQLLESKLRELLTKIEVVDGRGADGAGSETAAETSSGQHTSGYGFGSSGMGRSPSEY
jgi:FtsZ-binding cell division protein ZapB